MIKIIDYNREGTEMLQKRIKRGESDNTAAQVIVDEIIREVKAKGDEAVLKYTERFDHVSLTPETMRVTSAEIKEAVASVSQSLLDVFKRSYERLVKFHEKQKAESWFETRPSGEIMGQLIRPIERCAVYVPGGRAPYPASVLMNLAPAKVAGVGQVVMAAPPGADGKIAAVTLAAACTADVDEIYKIGGAQAIGALAYGTQTIPKVDKITGPGNIYVQLAKKNVFGQVGVDCIAGPSEVLVLADRGARPDYVAADMLSQAEHDEMASAILVTDCKELAEAVKIELEKQTDKLSRKDTIIKSLADYGAIILVEDIKLGAMISNLIAPEHLELAVDEPFSVLPLIQNAGAIFLGHYTPEPLGDYMAGSNHVLPTGGTARFFSALSVSDFTKKSEIISFSKEALSLLADDIVMFAEAEGFTAHAASIKVRQGAL